MLVTIKSNIDTGRQLEDPHQRADWLLSLRADIVEIKKEFVQVHEALRREIALNQQRIEQAGEIDTDLDSRYVKMLESYNSDVLSQYSETVDLIDHLLKETEGLSVT